MREPVIIHWLGDMFDPALAGYWGAPNLDAAMDTAVDIINGNAAKVDGVKVSLLDKDKRDRDAPPPAAGRADVYGRRFQLRRADRRRRQGILRTRCSASSMRSRRRRPAALTSLAAGDNKTFHEILAPTVPLSRHIFKAPTRFYKTGVVFMAYLNGHQDHFTMIGGQESARSTVHLAEMFRLADKPGYCAIRRKRCRACAR